MGSNMKKDAIDAGTPEGMQHKTMVAVPAPGRPGKIHLKVVDQIELDRLLHKGIITQEEWSTGDQIYRLLYKAGMLGASKSTLNVSGVSGDPQSISEKRSDALCIVADIIKHLDNACGQDARRFFINMIVLDSPVTTDQQVKYVKSVLSEVVKVFD
jgi:hypothetical protein